MSAKASSSAVPGQGMEQSAQGYQMFYSERVTLGEHKCGSIPRVSSVDWHSSYTVEEGSRRYLLGCTGSLGTQIFYQAYLNGKDRWILKQTFTGLRGSLCKWRPTLKWLAVVVDAVVEDETVDKDRLVMLKQGSESYTQHEVFTVQKNGSRITSVSWSYDGSFLLISDERCDGVWVIKWHKYARTYDWYRKFVKVSTGSSPYTGVFCPSELTIIVGGQESGLVVFEESSGQKDNSWERIANFHRDEGFTGLCFSSTWLAAIRTKDKAVVIWRYSCKPNLDLLLCYTITNDNAIPPSISWGGDVLVTYKATAGTVCVYQCKGNDWSKADCENKMGSNLFNRMSSLSFHKKDGMFGYFVTRGFIIIGYLHQKANCIPVYTERRDCSEELKFYRDELCEADFEKETVDLQDACERFQADINRRLHDICKRDTSSDIRRKELVSKFDSVLGMLYSCEEDTVSKQLMIDNIEMMLDLVLADED